MKLYLVRHGEAVGETVHPERPLSERGREDSKIMGMILKSQQVTITHVWHSGKKRAIETAEIIADILGIRNLCEQRAGLHPNDPVQDTAREIKTMGAADDGEAIMIVGHIPFLPRLASVLLTGKDNLGFIRFETAGVACLDSFQGGDWQIEQVLTPRSLPLE
ncbi:MAG: phosphohistidine phosphatase SixA [Candidatus Omnitrophica bacterium]|nr:phosphohistidine phosphatase SixA [Candidatus Omnitrophota bacterium]MDD5670517.1 phosphohistidine phosphatase SixA [Candidatus Omnitrophota bacterium]